MARMALWFLAAVASISLVTATPMPEIFWSRRNAVHPLTKKISLGVSKYQSIPPDTKQSGLKVKWYESPVHYVKSRQRKRIFTTLRARLGLPRIKGDYAFVGLQTLVEGAQLELRAIVPYFLSLFYNRHFNINVVYKNLVLSWPNLFPELVLQELEIPSFVVPWLNADVRLERYSLHSARHGLVKLGQKSAVSNILAVIEAFFEILNSPDLLTNFVALATQASLELQGNDGISSDDQTPAATDPPQPQSFKAFVYQFWFEVISRKNENQLRYYLRHTLAFQIIPGIIGQMLKFNRHGDALELANRVMKSDDFTKAMIAPHVNQVSHMQGVNWADNAFPIYAPNYFEFIGAYAIQRRPEDFEKLIRDAYRDKNKNGEDGKGRFGIQFMYDCSIQTGPTRPWSDLKAEFNLKAPADTWWTANEMKCKSYFSRHMRSLEFHGELLFQTGIASGENLSNILLPLDKRY